ncbi:lipopolysaccharide biosynthesis protein [Mitsuokella sp. UBA4253]|uniref:lipopolysaccharide biosynthesis protein n=1 Tax=Mitsuokella sp. UBA4253 TaxID=1946959 RepID=UPI00257F14DA|nr:lipopolysaccharide biosynthesis protein [Mitsuokella sp. UBA4253]
MMSRDEVASAAWRGMVWRFLERCSSQVVSFVVSVILARLLLPEEYGIIAMTMIFIALSEVFITSGLGSALIQKSSYDEESFSTMFWASVVFSLLLYGLLFLLAPYIAFLMHTPELVPVLRVLGLRLPISAMNSIQQAYVSQQMIFKKFFFSTLSGTISSGVVGLVMAYSGYGVWALVGQNIVMVIVNTAALHFLIPWRPTLFFSKRVFQSLYGFSWRIMLTSFIGTFFEQLRSFLIGRYYKTADLAFANRGEQFPLVLAGNISTTVQSVLFPAFSHLQQDKHAVREAVRKSLMIGSFLVVGIMAILAGLAENLIIVLLTDKWISAVPYLQWSCLGQCFAILGMINLQTISALGRADISLKLEFIKKPFWFLILMIGVMISPLAIIAGNALYGIIAFCINAFPNKRLLNYGVKQQVLDVIYPFLLAGTIFVLLHFLQNMIPCSWISLLLEGLISFALYLGLAKLFHIQGAEYLQRTVLAKLKSR